MRSAGHGPHAGQRRHARPGGESPDPGLAFRLDAGPGRNGAEFRRERGIDVVGHGWFDHIQRTDHGRHQPYYVGIGLPDLGRQQHLYRHHDDQRRHAAIGQRRHSRVGGGPIVKTRPGLSLAPTPQHQQLDQRHQRQRFVDRQRRRICHVNSGSNTYTGITTISNSSAVSVVSIAQSKTAFGPTPTRSWPTSCRSLAPAASW